VAEQRLVRDAGVGAARVAQLGDEQPRVDERLHHGARLGIGECVERSAPAQRGVVRADLHQALEGAGSAARTAGGCAS